MAVPVSDLRAYYLLHKAEFAVPETYQFRHIFVNTEELKVRAGNPLLPEEERLSPTELERAIEQKRQRAHQIPLRAVR